MKFRKKPVIVEAKLLSGKNMNELMEWCNGKIWRVNNRTLSIVMGLVIPTLEGNHYANFGDWIIKGVKGEFYPCKPDVFELTYEKT